MARFGSCWLVHDFLDVTNFQGGPAFQVAGCLTREMVTTLLLLFLNPQPSTLNPQPSTLNPQPSTLNPQPSTPNPQPSTLNPKFCS